MKILGGMKGITHKSKTLARFFLIAAELARISLEAEAMVGMSRHHELSKPVMARHEQCLMEQI